MIREDSGRADKRESRTAGDIDFHDRESNGRWRREGAGVPGTGQKSTKNDKGRPGGKKIWQTGHRDG